VTATYGDASSDDWSRLIDELRGEVGKLGSLEDACMLVTRRLYEVFTDSTALARIYAIVPHGELPKEVQTFVTELASTAPPATAAKLGPNTAVLSLIGTYGAKDEWRDRRHSRGHKGIPLISAEFVDQIPMLARLLKELGFDLSWLDPGSTNRRDAVVTRKLLGGFNGTFFVEDAATGRDDHDRLVIPAADFVREENVKTVFGQGGFYPDGTMVVCIVFTRETLTRERVDRFTSLITMLKGQTFGAVRERRFFRAGP